MIQSLIRDQDTPLPINQLVRNSGGALQSWQRENIGALVDSQQADKEFGSKTKAKAGRLTKIWMRKTSRLENNMETTRLDLVDRMID